MDNFPSFFKIIYEPLGNLVELGIPIKFMRNYGSNLSNVVTLNVRNGKTFKVEILRKSDENAWFRDGWPEFVEYYSLRHAHFLMFTYVGSSEFNVLIFDKTACEIEYPLDEPEDTLKSRPSSSVKPKGMFVPLLNQCSRKLGGNARNLNQEQVELINSYQSENPSFAAIMQPSYLESRFCLNIPSMFVSEYLTDKQRSFVFENESGDTWEIKGVGGSRMNQVFGGWKEFALDNSLRVGDICVFKLMNELANAKANKYMFKVETIRSSSTTVAAPGAFKRSLDQTVEVISIDD